MNFYRAAILGFVLFLWACGGDQGGVLSPTNPIKVPPATKLVAYSVVTASPEPQNVWLHYDYMVFKNGLDLSQTSTTGGALDCTSSTPPYYQCVFPPGFSTAPNPQQIGQVVAAFRNHGITLHIDPQHTAIPGHYAILNNLGGVFYVPYPSGCAGPEQFGNAFSDLKATYFHPSSNHPWHYAIFGFAEDSTATAGESPARCNLATGAAELPGFDLMVTPGLEYMNGFLQSHPNAVVGTFMHELGHNLGLQHGGDEDLNFKPNYLSVMSYWFQQSGIPQAAALGSFTISGYRLDYSGATLPTLDENHLNESLGVQSGTTDVTYYWNGSGFVPGTTGGVCPSPPELDTVVAAPTTGPVDWNCDGSLDPDVASDIKFGDALSQSYSLQQLHGFNDWAEITSILTIAPAQLKPKNHVDR